MTLFVERRRPMFSAELAARVTLAWTMIAALLLVTNLPGILAHDTPAAGESVRLVAALRPLLGSSAATWAALILAPLILLFACLILIGRIAGRIMGDEVALLACLAFAFCVPVIEHFRPMQIDHYGGQIACVLLAMNGLMARSARVGGWLVGSALALGLSISIEGLPLAVAVLGVLAGRWLGNRAERQWLVSSLQALAASTAVLLLLGGGAPGVIAACNAISLMHLAMFAWGAAVVTVCSALGPQPRLIVSTGFALVVGGALAIVSQMAPQCLANGPDSALPIWQQPIPTVVQMVLPPAIAIWAATKMAGRASSWLRGWWLQYAVLLSAAFVISIFDSRAGAVAGALAAIPLGWQVREWLRRVRRVRRPAKRALGYGSVVFALVPAAPAFLLATAMTG
ncbi:hypothetical protein [Parafrankia sp. BMG5.11]|uniref:hypothetical protein n=1 Tax=Parafrankia sp. BMG5.11 TaxID=222540 RepID=UPI00103E2EBB|nr:hypothetical protein [Parafrankia sp. BMG5.11]TCJ41187.1 hypothetical protein E0504_00790 [Parafrankia sp. BMG5.11]